MARRRGGRRLSSGAWRRFGRPAHRAAGGAVARHRPRLRPAGRAHAPVGADQHAARRAARASTTPTWPRSTTSASSPTSAARCTATRRRCCSATTSTSAPRAYEVDLAGFPAMMFMLRRAGAGTSAVNRARQAATLMATGGRGVVEQMAEPLLGRRRARRPARARATTCGPASSSPTRGGTARACPATCAGDGAGAVGAGLARRRGVRGVPAHGRRRATPSRWSRARSGTHFDPDDRRRGRAPIPDALFDGIDEDTVDELLDAGAGRRGRR